MSNIKSLLSLVLFFLFASNAYTQDGSHWESVIKNTSEAKFLPGTSAPGNNWNSLDFDDTAWANGVCSVGYGDGDDLTEIDMVLSVYLRAEFEIVDLSAIGNVVLNMDYDDAFVAYLNGVEIARSNIGTEGTEPAFNQPASGNHEALLYTGNNPETYLLSETSQAALKEGTNILAIQVHNVTANSSDMTCIPFLSLNIKDNSSNYLATPDWFEPPYIPEEFKSSNLPILIIETEGGASIVDEPKVNATLKVAYNEEGNLNYVEGPYDETSGPIGIEIRGNVTQTFPKKPYIFETRDSLGENRNVRLLGLPKENDWILRACYLDKTLMRNAIANEMSTRMGRYASRYRFCEVIINGSYDGVYMLIEKIKRDKNRVDIDKLSPDMNDVDSITGGYIYQVSQDYADLGERRSLIYPGADEISSQQLNYIKNYDDEFRSVMNTNNYNNPITGYPKYIDVQSFIDEIIVQEATKNSDAYGWSSYFHKDRKRKLCAGPVWDFDQSLANSSFNNGSYVPEWTITKEHDDVPTFWAKLFNEPVFKYLLKKRWFELRESVLNTDTLMNFIDKTALSLEESQQRNFVRWPILGEALWRSVAGYAERDTYQKEVDFMKVFLSDHLEWIDQQLANVADQTITTPDVVISEIMYSAYNIPEKEYLKISNNSSEDVNLDGLFFSNGIKYSFPENTTINPGKSFHIASDLASFEANYGFKADDKFFGQLDNSGERIRIVNSYGLEVNEVIYNDTLPWPVIDINNNGPIELVDLESDNSLPENWIFKDLNIDLPDLVISEIMYNPADGSDFEFIEIVNSGNETINLNGIYLDDAISYQFSDTSTIKAGEYIVIAANKPWFNLKYGLTAEGEFSGKLNNGGELVTLRDQLGHIIDAVNYTNEEPWPIIEDLDSKSIELIDILADNSEGTNWITSEYKEGTPMVKYNNHVGIVSLEEDFKFYPNVTSDVVHIISNQFNSKEVTIEIYNLLGALVYSEKEYNIGQTITLDVNKLNTGSYIVKVSYNDVVKTEKLTVIK